MGFHIQLFKELINLGKYKFAVSLRGRLVNVGHSRSRNKKLYSKYFPKIDLFHAVVIILNS